MSPSRHVPMRRCIACREAQPKRELVRLVRIDDVWRLDLAQRAGGRGTSLCRACALAATTDVAAAAGDAASRRKGFRRAFRQDAASVTALLAPIASTLATTVAAGATAPAAVGEPDARPRPNGGMHG